VPEMGTTFDGCEKVDNAKCQDSLDRARYNPECQLLGKVFIPCLYVEGEEGTEQCQYCIPALTQIHSSSEKENLQGRVAGVNSWKSIRSRSKKSRVQRYHDRKALREDHFDACDGCESCLSLSSRCKDRQGMAYA
jgi:hypothetical protein